MHHQPLPGFEGEMNAGMPMIAFGGEANAV